jgi:aspartate aminotransferase-like enzyme
MAPPGLAMISMSRDAWTAAEKATCPRFYFDFAKQKGFIDKGTTYTTPPVTVMYALHEGLAIMREEGLENVFERHRRVGDMVRSGLQAVGLKLVAPEGYRSNTVTAVQSPFADEAALKAWLGDLRTRYGLVIAGGQGQLTGKVFRVGHLGAIEERDVYGILAAIELGLADHGVLSRIGLAVPAAQAQVRGGADQRHAVAVG